MVAPFALDNDQVVVVVGSGAGGGTLGAELALKGVDTIILEAGGRHEIEDFQNDEWGSFGQISWLDNRTTSGSWRVSRDFPNLPAWIVKAVGGSTIHWAGASLRFQEHEFKAKTNYGDVPGANLLDWPIDLAEMDPWYTMAEDRMGVTRTHGIPGLPGNNNFKVFEAGAKKLGFKEVHTGRMAINSQPRDGRGSCQQIGFCFQGCKSGAKWSTLYVEIPKGEATGHLEVRPNSQVLKIEHDDTGKVTGVVYSDKDGNQQRQKARIVAVAGNSIESPRLLLNSASNMFPDGLANSSGQVGRNYMRHTTGSVYASFDKPVHMYRGTTMAGIIQDEAVHRPERGFVGGYELETLSLGLPFMAAFLDPGGWGRDFSSALDMYDHMAGMWIVGEDMPQEKNGVTLHAELKDAYGLPIPDVHFDDHENDIAMRNHAYGQGRAVYEAVGAVRTFPTPPYPSTHNLGTNRMSEKPEDGVVNKWGQTHDIKNLFVSDGSQFTTGASENPTLTIVSLALRQADHIAGAMSKREICIAMSAFPERLLAGYRSFHVRAVRARARSATVRPRRPQAPETMVIACCNSRAAPETIFDAGPGELFVVRNVANLVPPYAAGRRIPFDLGGTGIRGAEPEGPHIVVMGHGRCGGIRAALDPGAGPLSPGDFIGKWMSLVEPAAEAVSGNM